MKAEKLGREACRIIVFLRRQPLCVHLKGVLLPMILTAATLTALNVGQPLPKLEGEFLTGRKAVLPDAASGKFALLALGFTYDSRFPVEAWIKRFRKEFGTNPRVTFFEVPMIGGMARMGKWFIDSGMRRGTPPQDQENVVTVYGGTDPRKQRVSYTAPNDAYLLLLDPQGNVRWRHSGPFDEAAYGELAKSLNALLEPKPEAR